MNTVGRIAKNTGVIIVGDVLGKMISLVVVIYLARYLGSIGFGKYSFIFAYVSLFRILGDLGIDTIIVREISRDASKKDIYIGNAIVMKALLSAFAFISSILVISALGYPLLTRELVFIYSITLLFAASSPFADMFQVELRMEYATFIRIITQMLSAVFVLLVIIFERGLVALFILLVLSSFLGVLLTLYYSKQFTRPKFELNFGLWNMIIRASIPLAFSSIFIVIYHKIDIVMLSMMKGDEVVGYYSAAYGLAGTLGIIPSAFAVSIYPLMSEYFASSKESLIKMYERSCKYMMSLGIPIAVGTTLLSHRIIPFIYGKEFAPAIPALSILIWAEAFIFVNVILYTALNSINMQKINGYTSFLLVIVNISLNLILIPRFSFIGASLATVFTEGVGFGIGSFVLYKQFYKFYLPIKSVIASIFMGSIIVVFIDLIPVYLNILLGAIVYFLIFYLLKGLEKEDIELAKNLFGSIRP